MNVCLCNPRRDGSRACRDVRVDRESCALTCGRARDLAEAIFCAISENDDAEAMAIDPVPFVREARARGWTVRAPSVRPPKVQS